MRRSIVPLLAALSLATAFLAMPRAGAQVPMTINVDVAAGRRPIDPRIYGVNFASRAQLEALNVPLNRWGGNSTTRYNWQVNADNRANDWYYQSIASGSATPAGSMDSFVSDTKASGAEPMLTIPTIGWVAKLGAGRSKLASYSIAKYGPQTGNDWQWFPDAGNGIRASDGAAITTNDPTDASVPVDSTFQEGLVQHMVGRWGAAGAGGVRYYILDNEPSLWFSTHRDVHNAGPTMDEVRDRFLDYGARIKEGDPAAIIIGPEEWGWSGYFYSGHDQQYGSQHGWGFLPDRANHGNADYLPWLLDQLRQHQQSTGQKLLDVFTVHYYPQGGEYAGGTDSATQLRRNRSTRSLWDPSYIDETWIGDKVRLIPRLREWVNGHYLPGTPIGITEYSWGADDSIGGATAQADVLGIFGREGLDLATRWVVPATSSPTFKAFQMYRNYDGSRSTFGDVSVSAGGPDPDQTAVFAAQRTADGALTLMVVNKVLSGTTPASFNVSSFASAGVAQAFRLTSSNQINRLPDVTLSGQTFSASLPAQSVTLFVLPPITAPSLSVSDASVTEGDTGSSDASFTVTLSAASATTVTVGYATLAGTATEGTDYTAAAGTLTFLPGETSKSVAVSVKGDTEVEPDETFYLVLSAPTNAVLGDGQGTGTIRNDDAFPHLFSVGTEYFVSPAGSDANPCTAVSPCRQIRRALALVAAGDTILVADGTYLGFDVSGVHGSPGAPITIKARGTGAQVVPTTDRGDNRDTIFITFSSYVVIDGLRSLGANRAAVRVDQSPNVTVRNGVFGNNGTWGIFTDFSDDLLIENNECYGSVAEHGIYVSNSGDRPVLRRNRVHGNNASGIQLNADLSAGGDGIITGALIEANVIFDNGTAGGAAINLDGVQDSIVRNNVLYGNRSTGIVNYQGDGAQGPKGMEILHNTVDMPSNGRWALLINSTTGSNLVRNNILYNRHAFRGGITYGSAADVANTDSDYNILDRVSQDDGSTVLTLAQWQAQGHEVHSFFAIDTDLWVSVASADYHLKAGSPAIDQAPALTDATRDFEGHVRPWGVRADIGADEAVAANFNTTPYVTGLVNPTAMQFAPDGRLFICQQGGQLRVVKNGSLLATPFVSLSVDPNGERGLLGVDFDPDFATNQFVYVYYTVPTAPVHNRVSRFTASGDVAVAGSEMVLLELSNLSAATNHNGGALHFGPDGRLYVAVGENASGSNAQSMTNLLGKVLRINPDGSIPSGNPFYGTASGNNRLIWALGLRNPFTFAFQPGTGRMFINDVGESTWEEINDGIAGSNYGWPTTEGVTSNPAFRSPLYVYNHTTGNPTGCAITGGAFYNPANAQFPADYIGDYFFADYCGGWIWKYDPASGAATQFIAPSAGRSPVDLKVTDDGSLFYLARGQNSVFRVQNSASQSPVITGQPANVTVTVGSPASFTVTASGAAPLAYQWQRNGTDITGATSPTYTVGSAQLADNGARFRCRVTNTLGTATSVEAVLTVTQNTAPTASITQPPSGTLYTAGDTISYAGTGTDTEDGTLPPSAFTWQVDFHHDTHIHPFVPATSGATSGSFTIPTSGETSANVWYRIHLTVRDSGGLTSTTFRDVTPRTANVTLQTSPPGLQLLLDGQPLTAPSTFAGVAGIVRSLEAPSPQTLGSTTYQFLSWSDGGARAHNISTPAVNTTYTATFQAVSTAPLTCPTSPVPPSGSYTTTVSAGSSAKDWVAQYTPGSPNNPWIGQWKYVPLPRPGTVTMTAPATGGTYDLRLFANDTFTVIGSCTFQVVSSPALSINDVTVTEGNAGTVNASFTVNLSPTSSGTVTVNWATANGTATAPSDYVAGSGSLTFSPGEATKTVTVAVNGDTASEPNETFFVNLTGASGASVSDAQGQATITNDDGVPTALTCPASPVPPSGSYTTTVSAGSSAKDWVAQYTPGSPNNPWIGQWKYVPLPRPGTVTMTAPATGGTYDLRLFANDGFTVIGSCTFQVVSSPALSINDVTVTEGNAGTVNASFTVTLSPTSSGMVTVNWATANGTATAPSDYVAGSGSLTFSPGEATKTVTVAVNGDTASEPNETFFVNLTGASGASVSDAQGQATITNDDGVPTALTCPTSPVPPSGSYTTTVSAGSSAKDWVAQYTPGSPNNPWIGQWKYVPLPRPATVTMTAPGTPGTYDLRLFANDAFVVIGSCTFQVQ